MAPLSCSRISDLESNRSPFVAAIAGGAHPMDLEVREEEEPRTPFLPLRWESTGDQWWYATPIDWAAANGHYDVVRELLRLDANLLVKLTSLRRIRRLESVWDDDARLAGAARNRVAIARRLLLDCGAGRLVRAGYGGWLLYTAAAAGDAWFVRELLAAHPLLVFGEGEYGVTDVLYAAARGGCAEVFKHLLDAVLSPTSCLDGEEFRREVMNRAVHAAARGGSLDMLGELLHGCMDAGAYRDAQGSTILHAAAARGQVEVLKDLIAKFDIVNVVDDQGNTALHIAAFRGHLPIVEVLLIASPSLISAKNEAGDTFLHMALTGFGTPGFRRLDRQMELVRQLISGSIMDVSSLINVQNDDGKTALHLAVVGNLHSNLVELLMTAPCIDLNIRDNNGMTPLDLLRRQPPTASSEIIIKQLILAGGITNSRDIETRSAIASQLKMHSIVGSPGTSFRISDAEIFLHAGIDVSSISERTESFSSIGKVHTEIQAPNLKKLNSFQDAAKHLKELVKWPRCKGKKSASDQTELDDDSSSVDSVKSWSHGDTPKPLRQRYSRVSALFNNKRTFAAKILPSRASKMIEVTQPESPAASASWSSSSLIDKIDAAHLEKDQSSPDTSRHVKLTPNKKYGSLNSRLMNEYLRLGSRGLTSEDASSGQQSNRIFRPSNLSIA